MDAALGPRGQAAITLARLASATSGAPQTGIAAVQEAYTKSVSRSASLDLLLMTQLEWHREDKLADTKRPRSPASRAIS